MLKKVAVVGGIPDPIGGVTTFIRRVIIRERAVRWLFDLYPSASKRLPVEYGGEYYCSRRKLLTILRLWFFCLSGRADVIHFNFSTPRSLILLLLLPKRGTRWALTLHHGDLGDEVKPWVKWVLSSRVDFILALNERHSNWYSGVVSIDKIIQSSSYVPPQQPKPSIEVSTMVSDLKSKFKNIFVCSGFPARIYNHLLAIELMREHKDSVLVCCLYGCGPLRNEIKKSAGLVGNAIVVESLNEDDFNYLLSRSDLYLRLNTEDSFGIAVADAVNFGVKVVATKVCKRYPGAVLISDLPTLDEVGEAVSSILSADIVSSSSSSGSGGLQFSYGFSR